MLTCVSVFFDFVRASWVLSSVGFVTLPGNFGTAVWREPVIAPALRACCAWARAARLETRSALRAVSIVTVKSS